MWFGPLRPGSPPSTHHHLPKFITTYLSSTIFKKSPLFQSRLIELNANPALPQSGIESLKITRATPTENYWSTPVSPARPCSLQLQHSLRRQTILRQGRQGYRADHASLTRLETFLRLGTNRRLIWERSIARDIWALHPSRAESASLSWLQPVSTSRSCPSCSPTCVICNATLLQWNAHPDITEFWPLGLQGRAARQQAPH